jgi:hypothetical protein
LKRLLISGFVVVALLATATTVLRSHSPATDRPFAASDMSSLQKSKTAASANKLPVEEFEDMSLVFSTEPKR